LTAMRREGRTPGRRIRPSADLQARYRLFCDAPLPGSFISPVGAERLPRGWLRVGFQLWAGAEPLGRFGDSGRATSSSAILRQRRAAYMRSARFDSATHSAASRSHSSERITYSSVIDMGASSH
jgi:hypothetical protein